MSATSTATNELFGRERELALVAQRLERRRPFLLHGPAGVGKTALIRSVLSHRPELLYCADSSGRSAVLRWLAIQLIDRSAQARRIFGAADGVKARSAVSLKGIVQDLLRTGTYWVVLDHVSMPSQAFAGDVKEIIGWAMTPVLAIARSDHMEDVGFLRPLFSGRSEKLELRNFDDSPAEQFLTRTIASHGLVASNLAEFIPRVLQLSRGNPGAIVSMIEMAKLPRYRSVEQIMVTPLYVDFLVNAAKARPMGANS